MTFPPRHPDPLLPGEFLTEMQGSTEGVFVLGSLNRYVTVHSQQVRAINLVHCLTDKHGSLSGKKIAIVGAGFAGVTAAAYALDQTNAEVALIEAAPRALWLQEHCRERWLHPGLYDWPLPGALEPRTYLPVMNWTTGPAVDVVRQVREQWDDVVSRKANLSRFFETQVTAVSPDDGRLRLAVIPDSVMPLFDVVIFAVGFGVEDGEFAQPSYWNDVDGLSRVAGRVLISGFGDGGLADLLRLCLPQYRQDRLIEVVRGIDDAIAGRIVETERTLANNQIKLNEFYESLEVSSVIEQVVAQGIDEKVTVDIASDGVLYGNTSAILNRVLVSQLKRARPDAFTVVRTRVNKAERDDGGFKVTFSDGTEREYQHVVLRHGPAPTIENIAGVLDPAVAIERRLRWRSLPQALDRTRVLLSPRPADADILPSAFAKLPAYESSGDPWCLVIDSQQSKRWPTLANTVVQRLMNPPSSDDRPPIRIAGEPLHVHAEEALSAMPEYRAVVRALCTADILIADVGRFDDPGVMMLLGIRAAVRRGVTIVCTQDAEVWRNVPFNIREIKPISIAVTGHEVRDLAEAIRDGLGQSEAQDAYLDLPVYEYVRQPKLDESPGTTPVLFLRSFSQQYQEDNLDAVKQNLQTALASFIPRNHLYSVIDEASPRLATQRLYAAIRHHEYCVIDWSEWRANVFFEMGVRLAAHPSVPLCILDHQPDDADKGRKALCALFSPLIYESPNNLAKFRSGVESYFNTRRDTRNHAFEVAAQFFDIGQERYHARIDESLSALANATVDGGDPLQSVQVAVLYGPGNPELTRRVTRSSFEQICAAWCSLDERDAPYEWQPAELLEPAKVERLLRYQELGLRLQSVLATRHSDQDLRLRTRICKRLEETQSLVAIAQMLSGWSQVRKDVDRGLEDVEASELGAYKLDLSKLEEWVKDLGGPASLIIRQAIDHDLRVLEDVAKKRS